MDLDIRPAGHGKQENHGRRIETTLYNNTPSKSDFEIICGRENTASYGACIATAYATLQVSGLPTSEYPAFPGLPFQVRVSKLDRYKQIVSSDSSSLVEVQSSITGSLVEPDTSFSTSGLTVASLQQGEVILNVILKPSFAAVIPNSDIAIIQTLPVIFVKGIDAQSEVLVNMASSFYQIFLASNMSVCPSGFVLVLEHLKSNSTQSGSTQSGYCSKCPFGSYSVNPLAGTPQTPSCLKCPVNAKCNGGDQVEFTTGTWIISNGMYVLTSCPDGHQLVNSVNGKFSHDVQACVLCRNNQYILNPNISKYVCQDCPVGASCNGDTLLGLIPGSIWSPDYASGLYLLRSCPPSYVLVNTFADSTFSYMNQECKLCPATFYCTDGSTSATACPQGYFSPVGSNSSIQCAPATYILITLSLPMSPANFTTGKQNKCIAALAMTFGQVEGNVILDSYAANRRSSDKIVILHFKIAVDSAATARKLINGLDMIVLNNQLSNQGLPACTLVSLDAQYVGIQSSGSSETILIGCLVGITVFFLCAGGCVFLTIDRGGLSEYERCLLREMTLLRAKLRITRRDGFILSSERIWWWERMRSLGWTVIQRNYLEAAAHLAMLQDFDVQQFDAFCLCLEYDSLDTLGTQGSRTAYEALCEWILDICNVLIQPDLRGYEGTLPLIAKHDSCPLPADQRFPYFKKKICRARIWSDNQNALFLKLKATAKDHMNTVAALCNERFRVLEGDSQGQSLIAYPSTPAEAEDTDQVRRQDHPKARRHRPFQLHRSYFRDHRRHYCCR